MLKRSLTLAAVAAVTIGATSIPADAGVRACLIERSVVYKGRVYADAIQTRRVARVKRECGNRVRIVITRGPWTTVATINPNRWAD